MLYLLMQKALIHFNKGLTDFTVIEQDDYSLYVTIENSSISAHLYLGKYKIELGCIGEISQDYVTISDSLISDLNSIGVNLSYLQLDLQC